MDYPKCTIPPFEHNKAIFSVGQCPTCYRSNVINEDMKTNLEFISLVYRMREAQKAYFKNHLNRDLQESKKLEREVDNHLQLLGIGPKWVDDVDKQFNGKLF